ncbi:MAG: M20 family metallopeptidase [Acidimicrobiales bacterium]
MRLEGLRGQTDAMVSALRSLVEAESPSASPDGLARCASTISSLFTSVLGRAPVQDGAHLLWSGGASTRVVLLGHYDTVWPMGTLARWPFVVDGDKATGPGAFDMKAGIVQLVFGLATLADTDGVTVLLTADEEIGSPTSRQLIEDTARGATAALVLEASVAGALKSARKGTGDYTLRVTGKASHAGLEPEKGINALVALAPLIALAAALGDDSLGTTVTPTMAAAGTATNVVPASASVGLDVRVWLPSEAARVDEALRALSVDVPGASLVVEGGPNRPPMEPSDGLVAIAQACAARLGLGELDAAAVGGGSDGNFTAAIGTPTLDGLGAVGDGAHAEGEYVLIPTMAERAALVAELVEELLGSD